MSGLAARVRAGQEPVAVATLILGAVEAVLALLVGFEVITGAQMAAAQAVVVALLPFVGSVVRSRVTPLSIYERGE